jgi:ureidoacrylate peracid hydrolase
MTADEGGLPAMSRIDPTKMDVSTMGLLMIDMQNAYAHPEGTLAKGGADMTVAQATIQPLIKVLTACRAAGIPDFWSIQQHYEQDVSRARHRIPHHTAKRPRPSAIKGSWDGEIVEELKPYVTEDSHVFTKNKFGCFYNSQLETLLRIQGVDTLIVSGLDINVCVETTLREAYMRDYDLIILKDCVGGVYEEWRGPAMVVWDRYLGAVITSDEFIELLHSMIPAAERAS